MTTTIYTFAGETVRRVAWTGGDAPSDSYSAGLIPAVLPLFNHVRVRMYHEQCRDWAEFWHDMPNRDMRGIFWNRATHDAYRTIRSHYERTVQ